MSMVLPKKAKLEAILPGNIAIYDVSHILPKPKKWRWHRRPHGAKIVRMFFHHSGRLGADGFKGALNSMRYVVNSRDFGARAYHFWLSYKPDIDENGNIVIYRLAPDSERAWHTGQRANDEGLGTVFQGNLHPKKTGKPSTEQINMAEALVSWNLKRHDIKLPNGLSFHSEAKKWGAAKNKVSCPGPYVVKWVKERRERPDTFIEEQIKEEVYPIEAPILPKKPIEYIPKKENNELPRPKKRNGWFGKVTSKCWNKLFKK